MSEMAEIAVLHNTLDFQGGADALALRTCEALLTDHEVTLFTVAETAPETLAERFDANLAGLTVRMPPFAGAISATLSRGAPWLGAQLAFRSVLLRRWAASKLGAYDLAVSTTNELALPIPAVQYVHFPQFRHRDLDQVSAGRLNPLWTRLGAASTASVQRDAILANSSFTADVFEDLYGVRPTVLYPPIDPIEGAQRWDQREMGIVVAGRIAPDKRTLAAISVVDRLRERGHPLHLHVVGSVPRSYRQYAARVSVAAENRPYVTVERDVPRSRLAELLGAHRYGLSLKPREPFGMTVAEYVAAGMIPFAPDSGGQREILAFREDRLFDSIDAAVALIDGAIQRDDRPSLDADRFSREQFASGIRRQVQKRLGEG